MERTAARRLVTAARAARLPALQPVVIALLVLGAALAPRVVARDDVLTLLLRICLLATLAQSWNILAGFAGQTSLGHAAFFGLGALSARALWLGGLPFPAALLLGGLAAVAFAMLIGVPTFRLRGAHFAVGTLGVAEVLRLTVAQRSPLLTSLPPAQIVAYDPAACYELALVVALATTGAAILLRRSPLGLGLAAVREDEAAARATGVDVLAHKLLALALSSFFAGLAGGVFAYHQVSYYPAAPFSPLWSFDPVLIAYVGGVGTVAGPLLGALFFVLVQEQLALTLEQEHRILFGALFIVVVLAFPGGLIEAWGRAVRGPGGTRRAPRGSPPRGTLSTRERGRGGGR
jgi:branched-chain amino acid transport system permease protein